MQSILMHPVLLQVAPHLLWGATAPWWGVTLMTLLTGIALVWITESAKAKFSRPKTEADIHAAQEAIAGERRRDDNALLTKISEQYAAILEKYSVVIEQNARNSATVEFQTGEISRLRADVKDLQTENATLKARLEASAMLSSEISVLQSRVSTLEAQIKVKDAEITRLETLLHVEKAKSA